MKEHCPGLYNRLALSGKLYAHLLETEGAANDMLDSMMPGMAKEAGATEDLKAHNPMPQVQPFIGAFHVMRFFFQLPQFFS